MLPPPSPKLHIRTQTRHHWARPERGSLDVPHKHPSLRESNVWITPSRYWPCVASRMSADGGGVPGLEEERVVERLHGVCVPAGSFAARTRRDWGENLRTIDIASWKLQMFARPSRKTVSACRQSLGASENAVASKAPRNHPPSPFPPPQPTPPPSSSYCSCAASRMSARMAALRRSAVERLHGVCEPAGSIAARKRRA
jgi:hypothetical protein